MGRIEATFDRLRAAGEKALIPFITAGDPDLETSEQLIHALVEAGADLIELGVPFSDPDGRRPDHPGRLGAGSARRHQPGRGPAIWCAEVRRHTNVPIVLMGYYNPVLRYGAERFARDAAAAGVDGLLLVDLPPEEAGEIQGVLRRAGLQLITLLAPTTPPERCGPPGRRRRRAISTTCR